ncbi:ATP-dependent zinc metalloprotease FtsH [Oscillospiraceae bacterium HV4-5-C5C]|nr:ATP-dependent zinc metalloprotease FtsH [Oscillospiraceae bacterium HV4-5-C5C]
MNSNNRRSPFKGFSFYIIVFIIIVLFALFFNPRQTSTDIPYSTLIQYIDDDKVDSVVVKGTLVQLQLKDALPSGQTVIQQNISPYWMESLLDHLEDSGVSFTYQEPTDLSVWLNAIMLLLMVGSMAFFVWVMYKNQSGEGKSAMNFGRSRARLNDPSSNKVTFKDVAGAEEEKHELQEVVDFLKNPSKYADLGAKIPRGILLVGPPGTGKTLLAKAVAGEAGVPFFSISGSDFVEMFVGVGASRVRDLFETAKKNAPAIVFIDEIDAVGRQRGAGMGGGHDEREQTLNQLLVEMDGFSDNQDVIIIAATNRQDILDPALLRPGRFDRRVTVMRPDIKGREAILKVHARNKPLAPDVDLAEIAKITPGFTGADLANLLNEATLQAARRGARQVIAQDISEAVFKVMLGPEKKSRIINEKERRLTAYHESGHAIVLRSVSETDRVERVSIIPAGGAGGYTAHKPNEDVYYMTKKQLMAQIMVALGGRAAEEIVFGEVSTGASSDLQSCNEIARDMVVKYGMSERMGNMVFAHEDEVFLGRDYGHVQNYSDELAGIIDEEIKSILDKAYKEVLRILKDKQKMLEALSHVLLEKEKIEGQEFELLYEANTTPEQRAADAANAGRDEAIRAIHRKVNQAAPALNETDHTPKPPAVKDEVLGSLNSGGPQPSPAS